MGFGSYRKPDTGGTGRRGGGLYLGHAGVLRQDTLRPGGLLRGAGRGTRLGGMDGRDDLRPGHGESEEPSRLPPGPEVSGAPGPHRDRRLLPVLLLYGEGEHGGDGGDPELHLARVRGGAGAPVPERG